MPPKRDADVFDDAIAPGTDSASAVASVTRGGKKKRSVALFSGGRCLRLISQSLSLLSVVLHRSQTVKAVDDGQVGGSDTENV